MIGINLMNGDMTMNFPGVPTGYPECEDDYAEIVIPPSEELEMIELSIVEAGKAGGDIVPALIMLESCRSLAEDGFGEDYNDAIILLTRLCEEASIQKGGKLKPVGDYLGFYIE